MGTSYPHGENRGGKVIAEYIYLDEQGLPYSKVQRTEFKQFPQCTFVKGRGGKKSGWEPKPPKEPIPYNLHKLVKADKATTPLFICEGEKDADNGTELGLLTTTNPGGAGKWNKKLNRWFEGWQNAYILVDNDAPGLDHAQKVYRNLRRKVKHLYVVQFSSLKETGDFTDWIEQEANCPMENIIGNESLCADLMARFLEYCSSKPEMKDLPEISYNPSQMHVAVDQLEAALLKADPLKVSIVVRGGVMMQPLWAEIESYRRTRDGKHQYVSIRNTIFKPITVPMLRYMAGKHAVAFKKFDGRKGKDVPIAPPADVLETLLTKGHWGFPVVSGTVNAPTLRPDGTVLDKPGYDKMTGLWFWGDDRLKIPPLEKAPTKQSAMKALQLYKDLFSEVAFATETDFSVCMAAVLTAVARGAFDVCPMTLFRAPTSGTGKSFLVDVISHIATGRYCPVVNLDVPKEEQEKRIGALLLMAPNIISLDNLTSDLGSSVLCQLTERPTISIRILGKSEQPECQWRGVLFATGNNVNFVKDMVRRGLTCTLDSGTERPEQRAFRKNPLDMVMADRGKYIHAALTIVRACLSGKDKVDIHDIGSYGQWAEVVRKPLIWLGLPDPVAVQEVALRTDSTRAHARDFIDCWVRYVGVGVPKRCYELVQLAQEQVPNSMNGTEYVRQDLLELLREKCGDRGNMISTKSLGWWMRAMAGQVHSLEGKFYKVVPGANSAYGLQWTVEEQSYTTSAAPSHQNNEVQSTEAKALPKVTGKRVKKNAPVRKVNGARPKVARKRPVV